MFRTVLFAFFAALVSTSVIAAPADSTAPVLDTAIVSGDGKVLTLTYIEDGNDLDVTTLAIASEFSITTTDSGVITVTTVTLSVADKTITLDLSDVISVGDTATISSSASPISDNSTDPGANAAALLTSAAVITDAVHYNATFWAAISPSGGSQFDYFVDQQTGQGEGDIVGDGGANPGFQVSFYDNGNASNTDGRISFRFRLAEGGSNFYLIGIDGDVDGVIDVYVKMDTANKDEISIFANGSDLNISPSTSDFGSELYPNPGTNPTTVFNFNASPVADIDGLLVAPDLDGPNDGSEPDYYVSGSLDFADLVAALSGLGITLTDTDPLRYAVATSVNGGTFNQDIAGLPKDYDADATYVSSGAFSDPVTLDGVVVVVAGTPVINNLSGDALAYAVTDDEILIIDQATAAAITDADDTTLDDVGALDGSLHVEIISGVDVAEDLLGITEGSVNGVVVALSTGYAVNSVVSVGGVAIGTITDIGTGVSVNDPEISFTVTFDQVVGNVATLAKVATLIQAVTYENIDEVTPTEGVRTVSFLVSDGGLNTQVSTSVSVTMVADVTAPLAPTVDLLAVSDSGVSSTDDITNVITPTLRVTFDQTGAAATDTIVGDVVTLLVGATQVGTATVVADDITNGHVDIVTSVLTEGSLSFTATVTDISANTSNASGALIVSLLTSSPTVAVTLDDTALNKGDTALVTFTFSVAPTGFTNVDLSIGNGSVSPVAVGGVPKVYTATFTPTDDLEAATNVINVSTAYTDAAGNTGTADDSPNYTIDTKVPTVVVTLNDVALNKGDAALVTFTFSEVPTGFTVADVVTIQNGILTGFGVTVDTKVYTAIFTPTNNLEDLLNVISVGTGYTDAAGNTGAADDSPNYVIDTLAPTATVVLSDPTLTKGETTLVTFTFNEAPSGFVEADVTTIDSGTLSAFGVTGDAAVYTAVFTPTDNLVDATNIIAIAATYTDAAGNPGSVATSANYTIDTNDNTAPLAPSVDLVAGSDTGDSNSDDITNDTTPTIRVTFDQGGAAGTATVAGDTVSLLNGAAVVGTATVVAGDITNGYVDITSSVLSAGSLSFSAKVKDGANNESAGSAALAVTLDTVKPVITLIGDALISFERGLGYFDVGASALDNIDGDISSSIVTVNPVDGDIAGTYTVTYNVNDVAGNPAVEVTRTVEVVDTVVPGVAIVNQPPSVNNLNAFTVTFQFTEIVTGFASSDILFSNATLTNFINVGGIGDTYTADIKPNGLGDVSVGVDANVAQDPSGNNNTAAVTQVTGFDSILPVVVVTSAPGVNLANQSSYPVSGTCTAGDGNVLVLLSYGPAFFTPSVVCTSGGTWSASFNLSSLDDTAVSGIIVKVNGTQTDSAGNVGTAVIVTAVKDTVKPKVQIQNVPAFVNANEFTISIVFDEDVTGFDSGDISVTNGAVNAASFNAVDAQTYTVGVVPDGVGDVTLNVLAGVALDLVGNGNDPATPVVSVFDIVPPVVTITAADVVNAANDTVYTVGGSCDNGDGDVMVSITGVDASNQSVALNKDVACTAGNWTADFDVTPIADGINVVTINASQTDIATNTGNASPVQVDKDVVISVPTVNLLATNNTTPVITGSADVDSSNEIVIAGATYTVIATVGNVWSLDTAVAGPDSGTFNLVDGVNEVAVTSTDAAGNSAVDVSINEVTLTLDDDNDGIPNIVECPSGAFDNTCPDSDGDGIPDFQEVDSDGDGIPDAVEAGLDGNNPIDSDGDGIPDYQDTDSDADGIDDAVEAGVDGNNPVDTDGDGIPDYVDVGGSAGNGGDSDGDGIPDSVECIAYPGCADTDGNGQPDYLDTDSDGDGISDAVEAGIDPTAPIDTDGDGTPDYKDTNSDNDSDDDIVEGLNDNDGDGIPDYVDAASAGPAPNAGDSDGDGIADNIECELYPLCADSDNDGTPDYMEIDSDNDGISDIDETGSALNDSDNDGIDDTFDIDITSLVNGIDQNGDGIDDTQPLDTDGDGTPDYKDTDSDGDGINDIVECPAGVPCPDADNDGIPDQLDASEGDASGTDIIGTGDSDGDGISDFDECPTGVPCADVDQDGLPDYMDNKPDDGPAGNPDNDGLLNYLDPDDDNDSIPDVVEDPNFDADNNPATNPLDSDFDGTPDYLDLDSDNDGLSDFDESGASGNDGDGDNIDDDYDIDLTLGLDANADGIDDNVTPLDSDGDGLPDYLDIVFNGAPGSDTDGDGITDEVECPLFPGNCPDSDSDGTPDFMETDSDNDGIDDAVEVGSDSASPIDTDGDGTPDYRDDDSDNDGLNDSAEGVVDVDSDGIPDYVDADTSGAAFGGDSDGDGVVDLDECGSYPACADSNKNGTPDYMDADSQPYDPDAKIETGLNGAGSSSPWIISLLGMLLLFRKKITPVVDK